MKKVVILHSINHYKQYTSLKKNFELNNTILIIVMNIELRIFLSNRKIKFNIPEQYINEKHAEELEQISLNIGYNWHKDLFKFKGISLGRLVAWNSIYYFSRVIRDFQTISNIIEIEAPTEILTFQDNNSSIKDFNNTLIYVCSLKKQSIKTILLKKKYNKINNHFKLSINFYDSLNSILNSRPVRLNLKFFNSLLYKIHKGDKKKKIKEKKNFFKILMYDTFREKNLNLELSKINTPTFLYNQLSISQILKNLKNIFLRKKLGFHFSLDDFSSKQIERKAYLYHKIICDDWIRIINKKFFENFFFFRGHDLWPLFKKFVYKTIYFDFKRLIKSILIYLNIIRKEKPNLIILNDDTTEFNKTFVIVASSFKVHTLVLQHGFVSILYDIGFLPLSAEKIAVWGKISKNNLCNNGLSEDRIVITGAPRFDYYYNLNKNEKIKARIKKSIYSHFKIDKKNKLILFAPSHISFNKRLTNFHLNQFEVLKIYNYVLEAISALPNCHLIIKLHPGDSNEHIPHQLIKSLGIRNVSVVKDLKIEKLLASCDCLITSWSTTGTEAMILEKPVICMKLRQKRKFHVRYIEYGAAFEASSVIDLKLRLQLIFKDSNILKKNQKRYLEDDIYKLDGLSTMRVLNLIKNMLST